MLDIKDEEEILPTMCHTQVGTGGKKKKTSPNGTPWEG